MADSEKFVQIVEKYPCLYNSNLPEYARKDITDKAWSEVAREINWSATDCKDKWKNIRNSFVRSLKPPPSGSSVKEKKQYYLNDVLQFILPYVKPVVHTEDTGNLHNPSQKTNEDIQSDQSVDVENENESQTNRSETSYEAAESLNNTFKKPKRKMKPINNEADRAFVNWLESKKENKNDNPRKMFLLSLLPDIEKLSDNQMRAFRLKVLLLLEEIQTQPVHPVNSNPLQPYSNYSPLSSIESPSTPSPINYSTNGFSNTQFSQDLNFNNL